MATKAQQIAFINMIAPIAREQARKHDNKIFVSVCIAQAIHESGWGTAPKMVRANALFGIKVGKSAYKFGTAWKGAAYKTGTTEYYDGVNPTRIVDFFRQYDSVEDSTEDYFDMLCHCQRYKPALNRKTPQECINAIVAGGYATGPQYAAAIMKLINGYNLTAYDNGTIPQTAPQVGQYVPGKIYTLQSDLYVRDKPEGTKLKFDVLTEDGKKNGFFDAEGCAILRKGTRITCKAVSGNWMMIPSGWVCIKNSKGVYII